MSSVFHTAYGSEKITVDAFSDGAVSVKAERTLSVLTLLAAQRMGVDLIQRSGMSQSGATFGCEGVSTDEVTLASGVYVNLMFSKDNGAQYVGEVLLSKDAALALGLELIRMAGEPNGG